MVVGILAPECVIKSNTAHMASNELEIIVTTFDETIINPANKHLIHFFYGVDDDWSPLHWSDKMRERLPPGRVFVDNTGCEHAFVVNHSEVMAIKLSEMVADHMIKYALGDD
uniref:Uncharacterized protein n=1 Tax=Ditylenchus dipsaci TaxID=166011 RepID=A0A915EBE8_9BILA